MTTKDVIQAVATEPCLVQHYRDERGSNCTGLRWPTLSRECPSQEAIFSDGKHGFQMPYDDEWIDCSGFCNGSGRIPDVTLEKVMSIFAEQPCIEVQLVLIPGHGWFLNVGNMYSLEYPDVWHATPLEAACTTLMTS